MLHAVRKITLALAPVFLLALGPAVVLAQDGNSQDEQSQEGHRQSGSGTATNRAVIEAPPLDPDAAQLAGTHLAACDAGDLVACKKLGDAYWKGVGVARLDGVAVVLYQQVCDGGAGEGCEALAEALSGIQYQDYTASRRAYIKACDLGTLTACDDVANFTMAGDTANASNPALAMQIADKACRSGGDDACLVQSRFLREEGRSDAEQALGMALLDVLCRKGSPQPDIYSKGPHTNACRLAVEELESRYHPDERVIDEYLYHACYSGVAYQCSKAGDRAYRGIAGEPDVGKAQQLLDEACRLDSFWCDAANAIRDAPRYQVSCQNGEKTACFELGKIFANRTSVLVNPERALELLSQACFAGNDAACGPAADVLSYQLDNHSPGDEQLNATLLEKACAAQNSNACYTLAEKYEKGDGVAQNQPLAGTFFAQACKGGFALGCDPWEEMSGVVAEVPIVIADDSFLPPFSSEEAGREELAKIMKERFPIAVLPCVRHRAEFRGIAYEEVHCPPVVATVNGRRMKPGQAPWQALIWRPSRLNGQQLSAAQRPVCGGSLIAKGWILTAAHCLTDEGNDIKTAGHKVRLGVFNPRNNEGVTYSILRTIKHPKYNSRTSHVLDIALIQYDYRRGVKDGPVNAIAAISLDPLDVGKRRIAAGMPVYSYGWGWTANTDSSSTDYLQGVKMQLMTEPDCTKVTRFKGSLLNAALCAGGPNGEQTCYGDSGGPLVYYGDGNRKPTLIGVVSAGKDCGTTGKPSRYTRVAKVSDWIASYVDP